EHVAPIYGRPMHAAHVIPFQVLDAAVPDQLRLWRELLCAWPAREVMADPNYVRLFARNVDRVMCAASSTEQGGVLYPFILRPLAAEPWAAPNEMCWDIVSPYGYGGAFAWSVDRAGAERFWDHFDRWAEYERVVTAFVRL